MPLLLRTDSYIWVINYSNMKHLFILFLLSVSMAVFAQPKVLTQAIIITKTTIVAPNVDDAPVPVSSTTADGGEIRVMRFGGDGETKTTTWLKNDLTKSFSESEMGRTTVIRDKSKKITTTIMEMMGRKTGFYATDAEQEEMRRRMDSMMQSRGQNVSLGGSTAPVFTIIYKDESKKISGYTCKKALIIGTRSNGNSDTTVVWYCPDFKIQNLPGTGETAGGFGGFNVSAGGNGMEDLAGFPMQYEKNMRNGRKMTVEVTKLLIDKDVADKEFEISKDIEIKPMKDMQSGGGPGFQMRMGH